MCSANPYVYYQIQKMEVMVQCRTNLIDMIDPMNIEDVCVDDELTFLEELFKDECFEKTFVDELSLMFPLKKRNLI